MKLQKILFKFYTNCNAKRSSANIFPRATHYMSKNRMWLASRGLSTPVLVHDFFTTSRSLLMKLNFGLSKREYISSMWANIFCIYSLTKILLEVCQKFQGRYFPTDWHDLRFMCSLFALAAKNAVKIEIIVITANTYILCVIRYLNYKKSTGIAP
jgi:hypothetical protein